MSGGEVLHWMRRAEEEKAENAKLREENERLWNENTRFRLKEELRKLEHAPCGCSGSFSDGKEPVFHRCDSCKRLDEVKRALKEGSDE